MGQLEFWGFPAKVRLKDVLKAPLWVGRVLGWHSRVEVLGYQSLPPWRAEAILRVEGTASATLFAFWLVTVALKGATHGRSAILK